MSSTGDGHHWTPRLPPPPLCVACLAARCNLAARRQTSLGGEYCIVNRRQPGELSLSELSPIWWIKPLRSLCTPDPSSPRLGGSNLSSLSAPPTKYTQRHLHGIAYPARTSSCRPPPESCILQKHPFPGALALQVHVLCVSQICGSVRRPSLPRAFGVRNPSRRTHAFCVTAFLSTFVVAQTVAASPRSPLARVAHSAPPTR